MQDAGGSWWAGRTRWIVAGVVALVVAVGAVALASGGGDDGGGDGADTVVGTAVAPAQTGRGARTTGGDGDDPQPGLPEPGRGRDGDDETGDGPALPVRKGAASGVEVGIGEHGTAMFDDPRFRALGIRRARLVVAYDATKVRFEREIVDSWLAGAQRAGVEPFITFGHSRVRPQRLPSVAEFRARFREFHRRWPQVRVFAAWNEANHASQPTSGAPERAADFFDVVRAECSGCTVVAGDLLDQAGMERYLATYRRSLDSTPAVWGLHNYADTNRFRRTGVQTLLRAVEGPIWLTETGGLYSFGRSFPPSARRQARALAYTFRIARSSPRIERVYLYNWTGAPRGARFDAGLISASGTPRPAYRTLKTALGR
ncbi:glycosyl hydrolase [Conexibacter sp. SYSU D00693]|uniref:glycosyl hydrolase n=1 Tax=Conexibacter sp. SYSU D00693 TaxID=2812560 RepID=UPI00196ACD2E|nr:glycosyl hydrolase [Conexibacter sp. SYSU D00693]